MWLNLAIRLKAKKAVTGRSSIWPNSKEPGKFVEGEVRLGLISGEQVEVVSGVQAIEHSSTAAVSPRASVEICHSGVGRGGERCLRSIDSPRTEPVRADRDVLAGGQHRRRGRICDQFRRRCGCGRCEPRAARSRRDRGLGPHRHLLGSCTSTSSTSRRPGTNHRHLSRLTDVRSNAITRSSRDEPGVQGRRGKNHRTANRVLAGSDCKYG